MAKHFSDRTSTDRGMQIDASDEQTEKASDSIRRSADPDSKATEESKSQNEKHDFPIFST
jgi:hypothetical protein